jgi:hypothetical protein
MLFFSCEQGYNYEYSLENNTDSVITIYFKTKFGDSTLFIESNKVRIIFDTYHGLEGNGGPFFSDVKNDFIKISVIKGGIKSSKNYLQNDLWKFSKKNKSGRYQAVVKESEF